LHRSVLATPEPGNVTGHITSPGVCETSARSRLSRGLSG
jgi:hypothetical protein